MIQTRKNIDSIQLETADYLIKAAELEVQLATKMKWVAPQLYEATIIDLVIARKMKDAAQIDIEATDALEKGNMELWSELSKKAANKRKDVALHKLKAAQVLTSINKLEEIKNQMDKLGKRSKKSKVKKIKNH